MTAFDNIEIQPYDVRLLNLGQVAEYLKSRNWNQSATAGHGIVTVFDRPEPGNKLFQIRIPKSTDLADYDDVVIKSILTLAKFERTNQHVIYNNLLYYSDDLLLFRNDTADSRNGTVSLSRASEMMSGIKKSLLSAAHLDIDPRPHYEKMVWTDAEVFLDKCRYGQTRQSSYVMTVVCPLNAVPEYTNPQQESIFEPQFARRVTAKLASSIRMITAAAAEDDVALITNQRDPSNIVSANLCDALLELIPTEANGKLDVSFGWAKKKPVDNESEPPTVITLKSDIIPFIESVSNHLRVSTRRETQQLFYGRIDTLSGRPDEQLEVSGAVYSRMTDQNNDSFRVRIDLNVEQYKEAMIAHGSGKLVMIQGILRKLNTGGLRIVEHNGIQIVPVPQM